MLEDEKERKKCLEVVEEARERVDKMVSSNSLMSHRFSLSLPFSGIELKAKKTNFPFDQIRKTET